MTRRDGGEHFYKIGVTGFRNTMHRFTKHGDEDKRVQTSDVSAMEKLKAAFGGHEFQHPYAVAIKHEVVFDAEADARTTEAEILEVVAPARYRPTIDFPGWSECFEATDVQLALVIEYMTHEAAEARDGSG
jgi:hypothetical protein